MIKQNSQFHAQHGCTNINIQSWTILFWIPLILFRLISISTVDTFDFLSFGYFRFRPVRVLLIASVPASDWLFLLLSWLLIGCFCLGFWLAVSASVPASDWLFLLLSRLLISCFCFCPGYWLAGSARDNLISWIINTFLDQD